MKDEHILDSGIKATASDMQKVEDNNHMWMPKLYHLDAQSPQECHTLDCRDHVSYNHF